jgi:lipoprotein-anchoring transpeptidase ErfK/SrfK
MRKTLHALTALLLLFVATGCGSNDPRYSTQTGGYSFGGTSNAAQRREADSVSYWDGDGIAGKPSITINLHEQRAYFYKGDTLVAVSQVSSGREGHDTRPGTFKIIQKDPDHRSSAYGDYVDPATQAVVKANVANGKDPKPPGSVFLGAPMPHFMRITNDGVGMHAGYLPGVPASHGCIRMPAFMADRFFASVDLGTPVKVVP